MRSPRFAVSLMIAVTVMGGASVVAHETKEVAGLEVVFGAEPEPAINGQMQFLRWRFRSKDTKQPFADLENLTATVKRDGRTYGPFTGRVTPREPGVVATQHIFTAPGEYEASLQFRKKGDPNTHTIVFMFRIRDRKELEIGAAAPTSATAQTSGDAGAIEGWLKGYDAAFLAKDLDRLAAFYHPDVTIYEGTGINHGWVDYRDRHLGPELKAFSDLQFAHTGYSVTVLPGGQSAYATSRYTIKAKMGQRDLDSEGLETLVLVKMPDGSWRIRHSHTSSRARRPAQ